MISFQFTIASRWLTPMKCHELTTGSPFQPDFPLTFTLPWLSNHPPVPTVPYPGSKRKAGKAPRRVRSPSFGNAEPTPRRICRGGYPGRVANSSSWVWWGVTAAIVVFYECSLWLMMGNSGKWWLRMVLLMIINTGEWWFMTVQNEWYKWLIMVDGDD